MSQKKQTFHVRFLLTGLDPTERRVYRVLRQVSGIGRRDANMMMVGRILTNGRGTISVRNVP